MPVVEPFGLQHGGGGVPGDHLTGTGTAADQRCHVKLGAVPRHLRVLPADPRHVGAVGAEPGVGHEAGGGRDAADRRGVRGAGAVQGHRGDVALDVRGAVLTGPGALLAARVVLAHPPHLHGAVGERDRGGVGPAQGRAVGAGHLGADGGERAWLLALDEAVHALIDEVHEHHDGAVLGVVGVVGAVSDEVDRGEGQPRGPAVLVHPGAGAVRGGEHGNRCGGFCSEGFCDGGFDGSLAPRNSLDAPTNARKRQRTRGAHDRCASFLGGDPLGPPDLVAHQPGGAEPRTAGGQQLSADRGGPGTVGQSRHHGDQGR